MRGRLLVLVLCLLALLAGTAQATPQRYVTVSVGIGASPNLAIGQATVLIAKQEGFNSLRAIMPWTYPWQHEVTNDAARLCSIAAPAAEQGMTLFLDVVPTDKKPPVTSTQITWYDKTVGDYMQYLIGPDGCAPGLAELDIQVANEPNYSVFWPQVTAPEDYAHLLVRTDKFVHQQVQKNGFTVPVQVVGGELASSHDPVGTMKRMFKEARHMGVNGPFFDMFSYHCYGTGSNLQPTPPTAIRAELLGELGSDAQQIPLLCSEYAVGTSTTSSRVTVSVATASEEIQGRMYCQMEAMAVTSGLAGFGWFRLFDDPTGPATGINYYDPALGQPNDQPVAKSSLPNVQAANAAAYSGSIACG